MKVEQAWSSLASAILKQYFNDKHSSIKKIREDNYFDLEWYDDLLQFSARFAKINFVNFDREKKVIEMKNKEKKAKLLEMIKDEWVSIVELRKILKCSNNAIYSIVCNLCDYPIAEEKRDKHVYFKLMNKGDYE